MALKEKIIKCFHSKASTYQSTADVQPLIAQRLANKLSDVSAKRILEIGCGTGILSAYLVELFPKAEIVLTDIAPAMVEITRERFADYPKVCVQLMDGEALEAAAHYDLIVSSMTLHWFSDLPKSLQNIIKKLTPNGKLFFSLLGKNSLHEWRSLFEVNEMMSPTPIFPDVLRLQSAIPQLHTETELTEQRYISAYTFLKTLKTIGAHAAHAKHKVLSSGLLRRFMRRLDDRSKEGVTITYEVIYGSYTQK